MNKEVYKNTAEQAMRNYDEIEPELRKLQSQAMSLKFIIIYCSRLAGMDEPDDKYTFKSFNMNYNRNAQNKHLQVSNSGSRAEKGNLR